MHTRHAFGPPDGRQGPEGIKKGQRQAEGISDFSWNEQERRMENLGLNYMI
jgi:hypothetical protein